MRESIINKRSGLLYIRYTMPAILIVLIMSYCFSINVSAKTSFKKRQTVGVMATAVKTSVVVTWEPVADADGYAVYEADVSGRGSGETQADSLEVSCTETKNCRVVLKSRKARCTYEYYVAAFKLNSKGEKVYSKASAKVCTTVSEKGYSTIKNFLMTAKAPIGSTMYVWGGGWNKADTAAGKEAKTTGLSAKWRSFAKNKKSNYNYRNYRYQIHNGLDCSGYVGWCVYNVRNTANGKKGYVYSASKQAKKFSEMGFGSYTPAASVRDYKAGDILSSSGHVWIAIGQCSDGSVVLMHASPPGVQISGTATPGGKKNSKAYKLAKKYMKKYYKSWYKKYPDVSRGASYLSGYSRMRWDVESDKAVLTDPDGYQDMSPEHVLEDLFGAVLGEE